MNLPDLIKYEEHKLAQALPVAESDSESEFEPQSPTSNKPQLFSSLPKPVTPDRPKPATPLAPGLPSIKSPRHHPRHHPAPRHHPQIFTFGGSTTASAHSRPIPVGHTSPWEYIIPPLPQHAGVRPDPSEEDQEPNHAHRLDQRVAPPPL